VLKNPTFPDWPWLRSRRLGVAAATLVASGAYLLATQAAAPLGAVLIGVGVLALWAGTRHRAQPPAVPAPPPPSLPTGPSLVESHPDPLIRLDPMLRVTEANASARAVLGGLPPGDPVDFYLRHPAALETLRRAEAGQIATEAELTLLSPVERTYQLRVVPLGRAHGMLVALTDITKLRLADKTRVDFVANASHELRTPLATLMGFIETLQGPAADDSAARVRFLDIMAQEAGRMARLIDDLLSLSRVELDKHIVPSQPLDIAPLLKGVGQTLAMRLEQDQRTLQFDVSEPLPLVLGERDQLLQVLHNLVSNALKYGRTATPIRVSAQADGTMVRVSVRDEGEGIPAEHIPRLTERFYRIDTARSRTLGGTGLGLAIVKHIIERHRGELTIQSQMGQGTTVSFTLPVAKT
jgi:two-component system, OmpR family, phosphate regulon sensor histidine kinase PhoR